MLRLKGLIVDDMPEVREVLKQSLRLCRMAYFEFVEADNGRDALEEFARGDVDMCFVDMNMPKMSGLDFIREARKTGTRHHVPMIMVTGEHAVGKIDQALDMAGADAYLCKPFSIRDLKLKVGKFVDKLELEAQPEAAPAKGFLSWLMN